MTSAGDGRVVGRRYQLIEPVGRGGMGTVWQARDTVLGREVAVKEVRLPAGMDPDERDTLHRRTIREARTAARISHPSVVTVYDVVEEDGRPWIVMELVRARPLDKIVKQDGTLVPRRAAQIGRQVLAALTVAHASGVLHRDVKPSNVLISDSGRVVLTDFGIATFEGDVSLTQSGMVVGSPGYIPPERAKGERATPAGDLWSLGATLFMAVEGHAPYQRDGSVATLSALLTEQPPSPEHAGTLRSVIDGLLPRDPRRRLTGVQAAQLLDRVIHETRPDASSDASPVIRISSATAANGPTSGGSGPLGPTGGIARRRRPGRATLLTGAAVATALVVGAAGWALLGDSGDQPAGQSTSSATRSATPSATSHTPTSSASPSKTTDAVPAGYRRYKDREGFRILLPKDWTRTERSGNSVYFYAPDNSAYLQIDQTSTPSDSALDAWKQAEGAWRSTFSGYHRERMRKVDYLGASSAADAQFTWSSDHGRIRVLNRGLVANPEHGYAILWSIPVSDWARTAHLRSTVFGSFEPVGGWKDAG